MTDIKDIDKELSDVADLMDASFGPDPSKVRNIRKAAVEVHQALEHLRKTRGDMTPDQSDAFKELVVRLGVEGFGIPEETIRKQVL